MAIIEPMNFINSVVEDKKEEAAIIGIDFSAFTKEGGLEAKEESAKVTKSTKRRSTNNSYTQVPQRVMDNISGDKKYTKSFAKTTAMLEGAVLQTDQLTSEIKSDIDNIRASKSLKGKYNYLTNLTSASASLISTKVSAIKEINSTISQAHKFELEEMKITRDVEKDQSDDTKIMELYKAFVNTPVGSYQAPAVPTIAEMALPGGSGINHITMDGDLPTSQLTPEQIRMRMESNPNIITVVKFNQSTGQRYFDVIDRTTGNSIQGYPRPDEFLLENTNIDIHTMSARNKNIDTVWPLVLIGDGSIKEY